LYTAQWLNDMYGIEKVFYGADNVKTIGSAGNDTLVAAAGTNYLQGGLGDDTYIISPSKIGAPSYTTIRDYGSAADKDKIVFEGVSSKDVIVWADNDGNIFIDFKNYANNHVKLEYQHANVNTMALFQFSDGTMTFEQFANKFLMSDATNGVYTNKWLNQMFNNVDKVNYGGTGNSIWGSAGNDLHIFNPGNGNDYVGDSGGFDVIRINGVGSQDVAFHLNSRGELVIKYGANDQITVQGQMTANQAIERFELGNNLYMTNVDINNLIQDMSAYAANNGIDLTNVNTVRNNADLMQLIANAWHAQ